MISINIILTILSGRYFHTLWYTSGMINKYTAWEVQIYYSMETLFTFSVSYTFKRDHAGFEFTIGLLGLVINFTRYDTRHWNDEENKFYEYS